MNYIRSVLASLRKADKDFSLIDDGDKILVGVSGGKDSLALLRALSVYGKFAKKSFTVTPVFLDLGFGNADLEAIKGFAKGLGYELHVSDSRFVYDVLKAHAKDGKHIPCSICSRMKKAAMNAIAHELGYNKVAFAHHHDDAAETLVMNMVHGGRVATFEPKMYLHRSKITFIRPLIYCRESDLRNLCDEEGIPVMKSACPADGHAEREWAKNFLHALYKEQPYAYENIKKLLTNHESFQLYFNDIEMESEVDPSFALSPIVTPDQMRGTKIALKRKRKDEADFLIKHRHEAVGELSYSLENGHRAYIYNLSGPLEAKKQGIGILMDRLSKKVNPLTFIVLGDPKAAKEAGFAKKLDIGKGTMRYLKKIEK